MSEENQAPGDGNGQKQKWEELGFESEAAMVDAASNAADLRRKIEEKEAELAKERASRTKTDSEFMRQSNEIGELRKKLAGINGTKQEIVDDNKDVGKKGDDEKPKPVEVLESISDEEAEILDGVLNDPKNAELKKRVALGGKEAMAEFVQAYRAEAPVDLSASLFTGLRKKKSDTVSKTSIAKAVKDLFSQHNADEKNNLAAAMPAGAAVTSQSKTEKQLMVGGVTADFFRKKE